jgi:hypothetical protein
LPLGIVHRIAQPEISRAQQRRQPFAKLRFFADSAIGRDFQQPVAICLYRVDIALRIGYQPCLPFWRPYRPNST